MAGLPGPRPRPPWAHFPHPLQVRMQTRELGCRISLLRGSTTPRTCFHSLYRCTCQKGYVGDGSTCYGNILERLRELNTEPRGRWQGRLTSFISLLGTCLRVPICTQRAALFWAPARHNHSKSGGQAQQDMSGGISPSREGSCRREGKHVNCFQGDKEALVPSGPAMPR